MSMFIEHTYECNRCHKPFKSFTGSDGISILYRNTYLSICDDCTDEVLGLMGMTSDTITKEWAAIRELESEAKRRDEIRRGDRCIVCERSFTDFENKLKTPVATFHPECYHHVGDEMFNP